jgi:hypothetical protein
MVYIYNHNIEYETWDALARIQLISTLNEHQNSVLLDKLTDAPENVSVEVKPNPG